MLKLRQVEALQGQGKSVSEAVRQIGVTIQTGPPDGGAPPPFDANLALPSIEEYSLKNK